VSLREKNGKWEYRFRINGERVTKLTDLAATSENRARAAKLEQKHRDAIVKGDLPAHRQIARGFSEASNDFLEWCKIQHEAKPNTWRRIQTSLWSLRNHFGNQNIASIRRADIERFKIWRLRTHQVQQITLRHDLDTLSKFFGWAIIMDLRPDNPVSKIEKPSTENAIRMHVLTDAEEFDYFTRIEQGGPAYQKLADVARLMLDQGMRPDEVYSLERRGVDLKLGRVSIFEGKTKAARRTLKLTAASRMIVERRYRDTEGSKWLFPSRRLAGDHIQKLNKPHDDICAATEERPELRFVLYDLRHTFATRAAARGMHVTTLAAILGHSSLRMVTKYVHVQQESMDAEMERIQREPAAPSEGEDFEGKVIVQ
jgi:site-specific recombinase XerD